MLLLFLGVNVRSRARLVRVVHSRFFSVLVVVLSCPNLFRQRLGRARFLYRLPPVASLGGISEKGVLATFHNINMDIRVGMRECV